MSKNPNKRFVAQHMQDCPSNTAGKSQPREIIQQIASEFLPGEIWICEGFRSDYQTLSRFHYVSRNPATWAAIWCAVYRGYADKIFNESRVIGVIVLSYPTLVSAMRNRVFGLRGRSQIEKLRWTNSHLRTISRVVVHPQFRSMGIAKNLITCALDRCPTRFVEASARMGRAHPMFERAGMNRVNPDDTGSPVYYWFCKG